MGKIEFSKDGKIVLFVESEEEDAKIVIPSGVEIIDDDAFYYAKYSSLVLPKELREIGFHTLKDEDGYFRNIKSIEVESGNKNYCSDESALYSIVDGKKSLIYLFDNEVETFEIPNDVNSLEVGSLSNADNLKKIVLSTSMEELKEDAISIGIQEIVIPKQIKRFIPSNSYSSSNIYPFYNIAEDNKYLVYDENSIYEILPDDTLKLVKYFESGADSLKLREEISVIGRSAFVGNEKIKEIVLPLSLKRIEEHAFSSTAFKSIEIPESVEYVGEYAFSYNYDLKKAVFLSNPKYLSESAFLGCEIKKIDFKSKDKKYSFEQFREGGFIINNTTENEIIDENIGNKKFKEVIEKVIPEYLSYYGLFNSKNIFNEDKKELLLRLPIEQGYFGEEKNIEYVNNSENLKEGDPIKMSFASEHIELFTTDDKPIGSIIGISKNLLDYKNYLNISNGVLRNFIPKSQRNKNFNSACGWIEFTISEKDLSTYSESELELVDKIVFEVNEKETKLLKWIGSHSIKKAIIPSMIGGKPVLSIPKFFFARENTIEEVYVEDGIENICEGALAYCRNFNKVVFPNSIENIDCSLFLEEEGSQEYDLSEETVFIAPSGSYAERFLKEYKPKVYNIDSLKVFNSDSEETQNESAILSAFDMTSINDGIKLTFKESYYLEDFKEENIKLPSTISGKPLTIYSMDKTPSFVKKIIIPDSVINIEELNDMYTFKYNSLGIEEIDIDPNNKVYYSDGKAIYSKDKKNLIRFVSTSTEEYHILDGTEKICSMAFGYMKKIKKIYIPNSVKTIEEAAFSECESLESIVGLDSIKDIDENVLGIYNKTPFIINSPITIIGSTIVKYKVWDKKKIEIPEGITRIAHNAFVVNENQDELVEIQLPKTLKEIGYEAFSGRKKLKKINIPNGVEELPNSLFAKCESLEELVIPPSVNTIDMSAFPQYKESYGQETKCSFKKIIVDEKNKEFESIDGRLYSKDRKKIFYIPYMMRNKNLTIADGVEEINDNLLTSCDSITELELPNSIKKIGENSFSNCKNLKKVVLPTSLVSIGNYAFDGCEKLEKVVWSDNLKEIGNYAFNNTKIKELILPEKIETIGERAFTDIPVESVIVPKSVIKIGFEAFSGISEITIYDTITPDAYEAGDRIDTLNGRPNSMVGYIGIGKAYAKPDCAANHKWLDYTIIVKSAKTDEIKYKVWMGADPSQRNYYCFLTSAWGKNATFAFKELDEFFPKIRGAVHKQKVAKYRLEYPVDLTQENKEMYEKYIKKSKDK